MIKEIYLRGFKSFFDMKLDLEKLTLLTGLNSSGKSSVIQALRILERGFNNEENILLEGYGSVDEIKNKHIKEDIILGATDLEGKTLEIAIYSSLIDNKSYLTHNNIVNFPEIIYISANRFGPKTSIPIYNNTHRRNKIGENGENVLQCIDIYAETVLSEALRHENSEGNTLLYNLRGWLSTISPNVEFKSSLNLITDSSYSTFDNHRAANVGYGLSYSLPVIASLLLSTIIENSLVIIENPEAHLHPKGQVEMGRLIALCAKVGAQIIIETHSDHLFDGVRIATRNSLISGEDVKIHWFELNKHKNTEVLSPKLYDDGRINDWPSGFFDQFEINASKLF